MTTISLPETKQIQLRLENNILHLTLNRPALRNALSAEMIREILAVLEECQLSSTSDRANEYGNVRSIIIRGAGGNFCAGGDIKDMATLIEHGKRNDLQSIADYNALAGQLFNAIANCRPAVIAVLEGAVMGGGMGIAAAADVVVARDSTKFSLPETSLGLVPAQVAPFLRDRLGPSYARMLAVLGGQINAATAQRIGLIHYCAASEDELEDILKELLMSIRTCAPQALATAKALFLRDRSAELDFPDALGMIFANSLVSDEAKEGIAAFIEKRKPHWNE